MGSGTDGGKGAGTKRTSVADNGFEGIYADPEARSSSKGPKI